MKKNWKIIVVVLAAVAGVALLTVGIITNIIGINQRKKLAGDESGNVVSSEEAGNGEKGDYQTGSAGNIKTNSNINTGDFTELASEYEGRIGTGAFNYGEALQKSLLFYELQRSGDLPEETRCNWRGDSGLYDGSDVGIDLTGGLYDAGDHVKFNLPMAYTASMLSWSVYVDKTSYEESKQLEYALADIKWIDDYLMKCHTGKEEFYYQVGNGGIDHSWWGPAEAMSMERPAYKVDAQNPGSTVVAGAAAALASGAVIYADQDKEYSKECLKHAKELYEFAKKTQSDSGYTQAAGFYDSHSGFNDELCWAATWLYIATGEQTYLTDASSFYDLTNHDYKWTQCWDDVSLGAAVILSDLTGDKKYSTHVENNLDYWTTGKDGERVTYTPKGLAWLDSWGSLRYASTESFIALIYSENKSCTPAKKDQYYKFGVEQIGYCLGSTGFSYQIGMGDSYPTHPHHRTAQGSYCDNMNEPSEFRHTLYGALVGGPDANDGYEDVVSNYTNNEVACDYNAGFTGALARLYRDFGGQTLVNFGAVETVTENEFYVTATPNVTGDNFIEVRAFVVNTSAYPARKLENVTMRYYVDLSEVYSNGGTVNDISVTTNYSQGGSAGDLQCFNEEKHLYFLDVSFSEPVYPGGQSSYKKEVQFRLTSSKNWDNSNDYSYQDIAGNNGSSQVVAPHIILFEGDELLWGEEPDGNTVLPSKNEGNTTGNSGNTSEKSSENTENGSGNSNSAIEADGIKMSINNQSASGNGSTLAFTLTLKNTGNTAISLSDIAMKYYFTKDGSENLQFWCDYSGVSGTNYGDVTSTVSGTYSSCDKDNADTCLTIKSSSSTKLEAGDEWSIQIRVAKDNWSSMDFGNDYSAKGTGNIILIYKNKTISGKEP